MGKVRMVFADAPVGATSTGSARPEESKDALLQAHRVGDFIEILCYMMAGCSVGQRLLVLGEDCDKLEVEGGMAIPKSHEFVAWKWVDEPENCACQDLDKENSKLDFNRQGDISPIARKFNRAISRDDLESDVSSEDCDNWRFVEDKLMKALLKRWGDGSFEPSGQGHISAKMDLENSLRGAVAPELKNCQPAHRLTRQEASVLFSVWADTLYSGVHDGKPMVSLGEATMCLRNLTLCH